MEPDVTGLPLELAKKLLEAEGYSVESVDYSTPPPGSTRHRLDCAALADYVATAYFKEGSRGVNLRVVTVPSIIADNSSE